MSDVPIKKITGGKITKKGENIDNASKPYSVKNLSICLKTSLNLSKFAGQISETYFNMFFKLDGVSSSREAKEKLHCVQVCK